jgi:hypothetical protein
MGQRPKLALHAAFGRRKFSLTGHAPPDILNNNVVGYANISARDMLYHLFKTYGNITAVDLEINFEHMR